MKKSIYIFNDGEIHRKDNTIYFKGEEGKSICLLRILAKYV